LSSSSLQQAADFYRARQKWVAQWEIMYQQLIKYKNKQVSFKQDEILFDDGGALTTGHRMKIKRERKNIDEDLTSVLER